MSGEPAKGRPIDDGVELRVYLINKPPSRADLVRFAPNKAAPMTSRVVAEKSSSTC